MASDTCTVCSDRATWASGLCDIHEIDQIRAVLETVKRERDAVERDDLEWAQEQRDDERRQIIRLLESLDMTEAACMVARWSGTPK